MNKGIDYNSVEPNGNKDKDRRYGEGGKGGGSTYFDKKVSPVEEFYGVNGIGKIIQEGKHKDMIRQKGEYKKLWNLQKGGYIK